MVSPVIIDMLKYMGQCSPKSLFYYQIKKKWSEGNYAFLYACISDSSSSDLTVEEVYRSEAIATLDNFKFSGKAQCNLYIMYELLEECDQ